MDGASTLSLNAPPGGGAIENLMTRAGATPDAPGRIHMNAIAASATRIDAPATVHGSHDADRDALATRAGATPLMSRAETSCSLMSCAVCQRSSGSFARQLRTTRSRTVG